MERTYVAKILEYTEADIARVAHIEEDSFVAFPSTSDGLLDKLSSLPTDATSDEILGEILSKSSIKGAPKPPPDGEVCRFLASGHCMGLAPPGTVEGDWVIRFWDCDAAIIVRPDDKSDPKSSCALIGRADIADVHDRKGMLGDFAAGDALDRHQLGSLNHRRIDIVMNWHTLQRITASIIT
ncbi:hypothetical protein ONZ43_g3971 [Nemania bipapillata]|uniref:Uncharacterized protein n=1 Tax=Nemania bipapillata TaxID=110536 RepID=A0ACC2ITP1_9PEZI|nr:hypothetical protein ONZ43_g3971 [Nemania bipapillata]